MGDDAARVDGAALVDEAMKKSGLVWLCTDYPRRRLAAWHVWLDGRAYLLSGGDEQPDPGLRESEPVEIVVRSKDTLQRLLRFRAIATRLSPGHEDWEAATAELAKARLNLHDAENAPARWAADSRFALYRLTPTGDLVERPGAYPTDSQREAPVATPATTAGRLPWVLHRRGHRGRPLS